MDKTIEFKADTGGITEPKGFCAAAAHSDIGGKRDSRLDIGIIYSETPCSAAGVFTKNAVKAAPVLDCQRILDTGSDIHGVIVNSGNANACTGKQGMVDSRKMLRYAESSTGSSENSFLICSTGRIGDLLPMDRLKPGIEEVGEAAKLGANEGIEFASSILTSDTRTKTATATFVVEGKTVTIGGAAKGAGMIQPDMATMLAFLTTDIQASSKSLKSALKSVINRTFNAITVDGDMSTNDTVLLLANGRSGVELSGESEALFEQALFEVCDCLAEKIVADGERITKVVEILISGAANDREAENVSRAIGNSLLVKTSWYGSDPNWGRLMDALGYAEAKIDQHVIDISYDDTPALIGGDPVPENKPLWKEIVSRSRFSIKINLHQGDGQFRLRSTDLTEGYVDFNKSE